VKRTYRRIIFGVLLVAIFSLIAIKMSRPVLRYYYINIKGALLVATEKNNGSGLETIKLQLEESALVHLAEIYKRFETGEDGTKYYQAHNIWHKGRLTYKGSRYRVKVKSHGSNPSFHRMGKFISLRVKILGGNSISGISRFRLIIYERIKKTADIAAFYANTFQLIPQTHQLINLQINNWKPKLYFFEQTFSKDYLEYRGNSSMRVLDRRLIIASRSSNETFETGSDLTSDELNSELAEKNKVVDDLIEESNTSESYLKNIKKRIFGLNRQIVRRDPRRILEFFNLDYVASFEAARTLAGFYGHGMANGNLQLLYNLSDGKFYPVIHRDNSMGILTSPRDFEFELTKYPYFFLKQFPSPPRDVRLIFLQTLSQNHRIRQRKYEKIWSVVTSMKHKHLAMAFMDKIQNRHSVMSPFSDYFLRFHNFRLNVPAMPQDVITHWNTLYELLKRSKVEIEYQQSKNNILFSIASDTVSSLRWSKVVLLLKRAIQGNIRIQIVSDNGDFKFNTTKHFPLPSNDIDLSNELKNIEFYSGLNKDLSRFKKRYFVKINFSGATKIKLKGINLGFTNTISDQPLSKLEIKIQQKSFKSPAWPDMVNDRGIELTKAIINELKQIHPSLPLFRTTKNKISIRPGVHVINEDLVIESSHELHLLAGTTLKLAPNVSILSLNGLTIEGTQHKPVIIRALDPKHSFGVLAAVGGNESHVNIRGLKLSGGSTAWLRGIYLSGALSLYHHKTVSIKSSIVFNNHSEDGVNIKDSSISIRDSSFIGNDVDQLDIDYCTGELISNKFLISKSNLNGDAVDFSGSRALFLSNTIEGFVDKGISVGERSEVAIINNTIIKNNIGIAVKDLSKAFLFNNKLRENIKNVMVYQKKPLFGGAKVYFNPNDQIDSKSIFVDPKSEVYTLLFDEKNHKYFTQNLDLLRIKATLERFTQMGHRRAKIDQFSYIF